MTINNNNIFGAFTLNEARGSRLTGDWLHTDTIANYGWFSGGVNINTTPPATISPITTFDRIDFSNDTVTATPRGALSLVRVYPAATGNSNYGWFGAGGDLSTSVYYSLVDRLDFSNDSSTASVRGPLNSTRYSLAATANSNYGWFGGGRNGALYVPITSVDRIDFSNDSSTASVRGPLSLSSSEIYGVGATGNSNYGWFGSGYVTSPTLGAVEVSTVNRIDFSNDLSPASVRGPLSSARGYAAATGNSNYGWFGGSTVVTPAPAIINFSTVDRIDFSNDSVTASVRGPLSSARYSMGATGNSNYGWFGGGINQQLVPSPIYSTVDRIDFSNDSVTASTRGSLTSANTGNSATSGVLNIRRQKAGNYGWFGGGIPGPLSTSALVDRIDFSNDTRIANTRGVLSLTRQSLAATGNSNYGWFGGGSNNSASPTRYSTVDRIDFSNDSVQASPRGILNAPAGRSQPAATGNSNYGWFGGGFTGVAAVATVDRIDFSNDSATALPRGPLSLARYSPTATGNSNYGWFGGGIIPGATATVDRIDFSNDSATASVRGQLSSIRTGLAATGNSNYGWFGGGSPGPVSTVDRINFSNDSVTASPRGLLSSARDGVAATGNSNYGWFGGGTVGSPVTTVDRIDFSNDSATASVRGSITPATAPATGRSYLAATSNTNK
jgi:hypothetical protein